MGSGGLEFDSNDQPEQARLNQKTTFVGTGAQIAALSTTFAGQHAFCTSTGSGFTVDNEYIRNAANDAWLNFADITLGVNETSESSSTPITDDGDLTVAAGHRYYAFFTLPTTETLYYITGIEWKNGATVAGNVIAGIDVIDADPPTINSTPLAGLAQEVAQAGTSAVQRVSVNFSKLFRGGTVLGVWVSLSSGTATLREDNGAANGRKKATAFDSSPSAAENTGFTTGIDPVYLKVYYRGYD